MTSSRLTIATRGSDLALWQAEHVRSRLLELDAALTIELAIIKTTGDRIVDRPLAAIGGKALFVKEIEQALLDGSADIAVHSMKDVPAELAPGLVMAAISARQDPRDALVTRSGKPLVELPQGATLGTSSLRRACQVSAARPDMRIMPLRGNVPTRLAKVSDGELDATILAAAGLNRLGLADRASEILDPTVCLPAVGQGALGIEVRADDHGTADLVARAVHDEVTSTCVSAERAFLARVEGNCQAPLAAYAELDGSELYLRALIGKPDGSQVVAGERRGNPDDGVNMAIDLGEELLDRGGRDILAALQS